MPSSPPTDVVHHVAASDDLVHDLTRPVDTARGLVETVLKRGDQVDPATRDEALEAARRQLDHARTLLAFRVPTARQACSYPLPSIATASRRRHIHRDGAPGRLIGAGVVAAGRQWMPFALGPSITPDG